MKELDEIRGNSNRAFAKHRLNVLSGFKDAPTVSIVSIPKERTRFLDTENDFWWGIESEKSTKCMYELGPFSVFNTHLHLIPKEIIKIITKGAKLEWITERGISYQVTGDVFEALPNEEHALVNLTDKTILIEIDWFPKMTGWEAVFAEENK